MRHGLSRSSSKLVPIGTNWYQGYVNSYHSPIVTICLSFIVSEMYLIIVENLRFFHYSLDLKFRNVVHWNAGSGICFKLESLGYPPAKTT